MHFSSIKKFQNPSQFSSILSFLEAPSKTMRSQKSLSVPSICSAKLGHHNSCSSSVLLIYFATHFIYTLLSITLKLEVLHKFLVMDVLGVNHMKSPKERKRNRSSKGVKVTYISSPMKVKTCATKFRALVQELTGRDSDAERFMETKNDTKHQNVHEFSHEQQQFNGVVDRENHVLMPQLPFSNSFYDFPNCSDSLFDPFSGHFQMDVLRSFDQI